MSLNNEKNGIPRRDFFKNVALLLGGSAVLGIEAKILNAQETHLSATEAYKRASDFNDGRRVEISDSENAPENLMARVVMSEEKRNPNHWHLGILIAWTILNRIANKVEKNMNTEAKIAYFKKLGEERLGNMIKNEITLGNGFGEQGSKRPYASTVDPLPVDNKGLYYRLFGRMILEGLFNDYDFGQVNFFHEQAQREAHLNKKSKSPEDVTADWESRGLEKVLTIPNYVVFFKEK